MSAIQDSNIVERGKTDFNAAADAKQRLALVRSASDPEPLANPLTDDIDDTRKTRSTPAADRRNPGSQPAGKSANRDSIIAEYQGADLNRRLQLYLQYPGMESDFDRINRDDRYSDTSADVKLQIRSFATQMGMALGSAMGCRGPVC